ncbi:MAG: sugar MFS transporter [Acidobacteriaceae bacterium]
MSSAPADSRAVSPDNSNTNYGRPLAIVTTLFFMWGALTALNDILIPHLKSIFDLNYAKVMLVNSAFFGAYFVFSIPSSKVIESIGYKRSMVTGLFVMALGTALFIPAASVAFFPLFLTALIVLAAGITLLQVSANPYVSVLGRPETASSRLNLTQAFNSLGTTVAPYIGGLLILSAAPMSSEAMHNLAGAALHAYRTQGASSVKMPYLVLTVALALLGVVIALSRLPQLEALEQPAKGEERTGHGSSLWHYRQLVLGAVGIFTYVGAEVAIGSFLVNYMSQSYIGGISEQTAAKYVAFYWGGAMVGRFIGSGLLQKIRTGKLLMTVALVAASLVATSMLTFGHIAMWTILAVGLFNSIMFPSIFTLGIDGLGNLTSKASGILIMAIVGGAIIPVAQGVIADRIGIHHAFILPILCYLYIAYFAFDRYQAEAANPHAA